MADVVSSGQESINTNEGVVSINKGKDNLLFFDGDVYRMIVGFDENKNPKVKISEAGVSVLDATDDQLIFNSDQNVLKVADEGTVLLVKPANDGYQSISISYDLDYPPMVMAFLTSESGFYDPLPKTSVRQDTGAVNNYMGFNINHFDKTINFFVVAPNLGGGPYTIEQTLNIKYYLLQQSAN